MLFSFIRHLPKMSPKIQYPLPNIDLSEIIVPGLEEAIAKAQITADNAQNAADAAQEFAESVFGELKALKDALGVYSEAGKLEAKINELEAMESTLNAKDEQFAELIKQLDEELESNISSLREEIFALMVNKEEFAPLVQEQIRRSIEEENGRINQAISDAIIEVTNNLMSQIDELVKEVNYYERAWSALDEAAKMMSVDVDDITPVFDYIVQYYDIHDSPAADIATYFNVERVDPYGLKIDMAESDTMTDVAGSYVLATNTFAFGEDSRFGRKTVLENAGKYKVIDQPADIGITAGKE